VPSPVGTPPPCLTMLRAKVSLLSALALGCTRPVPSARPPADAKPAAEAKPKSDAEANPRADTSPPPGDLPLVKIVAFDCEKYDLLPNETPPKGLIAPGAGIRGWRGGGPFGARWNVEELRCVVRASTPCARGSVSFTFRAGTHVVAERKARVSNGTADVEIVAPSTAWERSYDSPAKAAAPLRLPFKTATFRVQALLDCEAPTKASLRDWNYRYVAADDAFVAGFANGE